MQLILGKVVDTKTGGFTLIELSIALVIIGLIVGGVLAGQDLIGAAAARAQISQVEKFNAAANTFRVKYGYLPGDLPDPDATKFGFLPRTSIYTSKPYGEGDGNGSIEALDFRAQCYSNPHQTWGADPFQGEEAMFWVDLSTAHMIDQSFNTATPGAQPATRSIYGSVAVNLYLPQAKLGNNNVAVGSLGWQQAYTIPNGAGPNYFVVANFMYNDEDNCIPGSLANDIAVQYAYAIDRKMDDGLPQSGNVQALYFYQYPNDVSSTTGGPVTSSSDITTPDSTYCYDGSAGLPEKYSVEIAGGKNANCKLLFMMQ